MSKMLGKVIGSGRVEESEEGSGGNVGEGWSGCNVGGEGEVVVMWVVKGGKNRGR